MQNVPCSERETGRHPPPPPSPSPRSVALLPRSSPRNKGFRRHGNIGHFQKRSLANYWDECIWNVMLKARCYRLAPLAIWRKSYSSNLCSKYMHQKLFFRAQNAKLSLPWPDPPPARSLRSLAILLADYFRRVSETWNKKNSPICPKFPSGTF